MKKIFLCIFLVVTTILSTALPVFASESQSSTIITDDGTTITYFADGSTLTVSPARDADEQYGARAPTQSVTKSKDVTYEDANCDVSWKYTLTATFSYEYGVSSTCTSTSYKKSISNNSWSFSDGSATKSGNVATGNGTFKYKVLLITIKTYNIDIHLTCDKYGNVT